MYQRIFIVIADNKDNIINEPPIAIVLSPTLPSLGNTAPAPNKNAPTPKTANTNVAKLGANPIAIKLKLIAIEISD